MNISHVSVGEFQFNAKVFILRHKFYIKMFVVGSSLSILTRQRTVIPADLHSIVDKNRGCLSATATGLALEPVLPEIRLALEFIS